MARGVFRKFRSAKRSRRAPQSGIGFAININEFWKKGLNINVAPTLEPGLTSRHPESISNLLRGNGRHRVLFGSNHPFWPAGECIAGLDDLQLDADARTAFLTDNARRLFKLA